MRKEVRLSGFGGQGIILAGEIVGKAAALYDRKYATFTQGYGPESRGGACSAEVIIDERPVHYPHVLDPDVLVVMSQGAYNRYVPEFSKDGMLVIDDGLVTLDEMAQGRKVLAIPATRIAEEVGRKLVANIVMLGFLAAVTDLTSVEAMRQAVLTSIPKGTEDLNIRAFQAGFDYGRSCGPPSKATKEAAHAIGESAGG
jgi:2-oxoglutarate ferredoxin oxidoreductase subunit gamma